MMAATWWTLAAIGLASWCCHTLAVWCETRARKSVVVGVNHDPDGLDHWLSGMEAEPGARFISIGGAFAREAAPTATETPRRML